MKKDGFFVEVSHRPRRVAFRVDMDQCSDAMFDEIVDFNVLSWGGRYNPIIPVQTGGIPEHYWRLLTFVDPDILYCYSELPMSLAKRILSGLSPLTVFRHSHSLPHYQDQFRVRIDRQATTRPLLKQIAQRIQVTMRNPDPSVLVFDYNDAKHLSPFTRRNFGGNAQIHMWCRDNTFPSFQVPNDDKEVMKALAANRNLVIPMQVCAESPRQVTASTNEWDTALTLYCGSSPWTFIEYWNHAQFRDEVSGVAASTREMWIPPTLLEDKSFYECFVELIRRRVFVSEHNKRLRLVSYDQSPEHLRELTKKICSDFKWGNLYPAEPVIRQNGELPEFETRTIPSFFPRQHPQYEYLIGNGSFLQLNPPLEAPQGADEAWMAEFAIENPGQESYFANKTPWWKLPKKLDIARLFVAHAPSRVSETHRVSAQVSGQQQGVILNTPDLATLFGALVLPDATPDWLRKLEGGQSLGRTGHLYVTTSDKGKYAGGVLGLFETLRKAAFVFEHAFWRELIESMSVPRASDQTRNKVRADLERIGIGAVQISSGIDQLVDEVLDAASRIQRPSSHANFQRLFERYWGYLNRFSKEQMLHEVWREDTPPSSPDQKDVRNAARNNLRNMLSELTKRKLFLQGAEIRCIHCLTSLWYHVEDLRNTVTCRGCRNDIHLPAEIPWSYSLNELVVSAVRDHGVIPVIRTAYHLFKNSRECFCFLPGLEIRDYSSTATTQVCELDLVWIKDGEFGIAEVKSTPKKFSVSKDLAETLAVASPDRFLLVSASGTNDEMEAIRSQVHSRLGSALKVEAWSLNAVGDSFGDGWNTQTYSLMG
jgi:hypothetical protein